MTIVGRNDQCACGSGKKYKQCCMQQKEAFRCGNSAAGMTSRVNDIAQMLRNAIAYHQVGRLSEAEAIYRQILQLSPRHSDSLHLLGMIAYQSGNYEIATDLIQQAITAEPKNPAHYNLLGSVINEQGKLEEAIGYYRKAISIKPDFAEAHFNLGNAHKKLGETNNAVTSYRKAIALKPDYVKAHCYLGNALQEQGNLDDAVASYRKAISLQPGYAEAHNGMGVALMTMDRLKEAEASFRRALEINLDYAEGHDNLGVVLQGLGRNDEAEISHRRALAINPEFEGAHRNLGVVLQAMDRLDESLESYRQSFRIKNNLEEVLLQLTTPLVKSTGLRLDSPNGAKKSADCVSPPAATTRPEFSLLPAGDKKQNVEKKLRIMLIYPPPWQIESPANTHLGMPFGAPQEKSDRDIDGDFQVITYGLLTIAAQAKRTGHDVSVYNLSTCLWQDVVTLIAETEADVYGLSAFTANRRGMGAVATLIRQYHPQAHIIAGGPFVTALPLETLRYFRDIDTAVIGEGESTFMELLACLGSGRSTVGIPGTAWRNGEEPVAGPIRPRIDNLDLLASPFDYFTSHIVMTSRGCPACCSFCGSFTTWGKMLRFHSAAYCLDTFRKALARLPIPFIAIKDDTFTAHRRRTIEICDTITENKMNFMWSCDSRVDSLDDELLRKMRRAGCQMISFGVESGSPDILKSIRKKTTPAMVLEATRSAQKYGLSVRYYMMHLNRGETLETIEQSNDLVKAGRPNSYLFGALTFFPGTEEWTILCEQQGITPDIFFRNDFKELSVVTNRRKEYETLHLHGTCDIGTMHGFNFTVEEREAIVDRLPDFHTVHAELANAYFQVGRLDEAVLELNRAEELGFPIHDIIYNQRACIALARGEVDNALTLLKRAIQTYPHIIVLKNLKKLQDWAALPMNSRGKPPLLNDSVYAIDFQSATFPSARPAAL